MFQPHLHTVSHSTAWLGVNLI